MKLLYTLLFVLTVSISALGDNQQFSEVNIYPLLASDKLFFLQIRKAVLTNDIKWLSEAVLKYPFAIKVAGKTIKLKDKKDFVEHAKLILQPMFKSVVSQQSPETLSKNWEGIMVGNGVIWFTEVEEKDLRVTYRILSIFVPDGETKVGPPQITNAVPAKSK